MRRLLTPILAPRWVLAELSAGCALSILAAFLPGTMHVWTVGRVTAVQFGERFIVGGWGHALPSVSITSVAIALALPGAGWAVWWLIHLDSPRKGNA